LPVGAVDSVGTADDDDEEEDDELSARSLSPPEQAASVTSVRATTRLRIG
jgi:hypothetical protein